MFKKIMSLILCAAMLALLVFATACEEYEELEADSRIPTTLNIIGITEASTKPEDVAAVEAAINKITKARYETGIKLTLVTLDEYYDLIEARVAEAEYNTNVDKAIQNYNAYVKSEAETAAAALQSSSNSKKKWVKTIQTVAANTLATRSLYTEEQTTVLDDGTIETLYPEPASSIDIIMIAGRDMYNYLDEQDLLISLENYLDTSFKKLRQYIYPTYFTELKNLTGDIKAIPNNNLLGNYKYLVVNKELADKYNFNINSFKTYSDLSAFLASVKAGESDVTPIAGKPDALGIYYVFSEDIAIGTYFDPLLGYDTEEGTSFTVSNLLEVPQYVNYMKTMEDFEKNGYIGSDSDENWAVKVITGDASVGEYFNDEEGNYYCKVIQNPFAESDIIFQGMFGVSSYTSNAERAMEIVEMINTDSEVKNLLQYGIEGENYSVNSDGTITRLNRNYLMNNALTGNIYMGYPEEGMSADSWKYVKQTNLDSGSAPFLIYDITDEKMDALLDSIIERAIMNEAFAEIGITYDDYLNSEGKSAYATYSSAFRKKHEDFFKQKLRESGVVENSIKTVFANTSHSVYSPKWYIDTYVAKVKEEKYANISTLSGIDTLIKNEIASVVGVAYSTAENKSNSFETYRTKAKDYYTNIEYLRIMTKLTLFADLSEEEIARYDAMSNTDFEQAVFEYVKQNYIEENNITEEDYDKLVKDFIAADLVFTDSATKSTYSVSWDYYQETKAAAVTFQDAAARLRSAYADLLATKYTDAQLDAMNALTLTDTVHDLLYAKYLSDNGTTKMKLESDLKDVIASAAGKTYDEMQLDRSDTTKYDGYINSIRSAYKDVLVEAYSLDQYKEGKDGISNADVMSTVLAYLIEEQTGIYKEMYEAMGFSKSEYTDARAYMENFKQYATMMREKSYYTLATQYTDAEINAFTLNDIDGIVYDIMYSTGFYTNIMAQYVGKQLSGSTGYMIAKKNAVNYTKSIDKLISYYAKELEAAGITVSEAKSMNPEDVEDVIYSFLEEKYVAQFAQIEDLLSAACKDYYSALESTTDVASLIASQKKELNNNALFTAVVGSLSREVETYLASLAETASK